MRRYIDDLEFIVREALILAGAIEFCPTHPEVAIRTGDRRAEARVYEYVCSLPKRDGTMWLSGAVKDAIQNELTLATDKLCWKCYSDQHESDLICASAKRSGGRR